MRWLKRGAFGLVVVLVVALVAGAITVTWSTRRSFPTTSGELDLPGLTAPVTVYRDTYGVPTIVAQTSDDLFRAQGYVHAQDRFFEMDTRRHITAGRIAELFGADQLGTDRFVRSLGWRATAEAELELLAPETVAMLEAYADGVNAWISDRRGSALSLEHALLRLTGAGGYQPEPWTPTDSVAWLKAMAWDLRSNFEDELARARLTDVDLGPGRALEDLYPSFPADRHPVILPEGGTVEDRRFIPRTGVTDPDDPQVKPSDILAVPTDTTFTSPRADSSPRADDPGSDRNEARAGHRGSAGAATPDPQQLAEVLAAAHESLAMAPHMLGDVTADGIGSNSWVLGPERSATGSALLANDPHLAPAQPSLWYQVGLQCEPVGRDCPYQALGFSFSGVPGIVIGQNADVAWGFTNLGADVTDLVIERIDGDHYLTENGWEPLQIHQETLKVAGGDDVTIDVRATRHGPLLSDISEPASEVAEGSYGAASHGRDDGETYAVALSWVALHPVRTMDAVPAFMQASDWPSFRAAASHFHVPSQNLVYADADGHIGYQAPGLIPVRRAGDGTEPVLGWSGDAGWERFLEFEELPWTFDPDAGYLATANQPVLPPGQDPYLAVDVNRGHRGDRIVELLEAQPTHDIADLVELQLDNHNAGGVMLTPALLAVEPAGDAQVAQMQQVLDTWDHRNDTGSAGAAAFNATWRHLLALVFHDVLPEWAWPDGGGRWWEVVSMWIDDPANPWWDDAGSPNTRQRDEVLHAAMAAAYQELTEVFGDDPEDWRWGEMHTLTLTHGTFGSSGIGPLERLFNRGPLELSGGSDVVNATGWSAASGYEVTWVPSMRMVVDVGDLDAGRWINLTGQSGRPFHRHYVDQAELWRDGETIPMTFSLPATRAIAVEELTLVP